MFFSFPHIGIDDSGEVGAISRPGRPKVSHACGALLKALAEVKNEGVGRNFSIPGGYLGCVGGLGGIRVCTGVFGGVLSVLPMCFLITLHFRCCSTAVCWWSILQL